MAEKSGTAVRVGFLTGVHCNSREVTGSLLMFRLLFSEESCEGNDVRVDRLLVLLAASVGRHVVHYSWWWY